MSGLLPASHCDESEDLAVRTILTVYDPAVGILPMGET